MVLYSCMHILMESKCTTVGECFAALCAFMLPNSMGVFMRTCHTGGLEGFLTNSTLYWHIMMNSVMSVPCLQIVKSFAAVISDTFKIVFWLFPFNSNGIYFEHKMTRFSINHSFPRL